MKNGLIINQFGSKFWYKNDKLHREDGPAIEYTDGSKVWYQNGLRHRIDGPAIERDNGYKAWYQNGMRHRLDGPAIEFIDDTSVKFIDGLKEWYYKDKFITNKSQAEFERIIRLRLVW